MKNRKNNKGFSLVELIVVVAIMAVLVGVLAPAYLRYVEKSRYQKDMSAIAEVEEAIKIAVAEEDIFDDITVGQTYTVTVADNAQPACSALADLQGELQSTISTVDFASKTIANAGNSVNVTFSVTADGAVTVGNNAPAYS